MCCRYVTKIGTNAEMFENDYIHLLFTFIVVINYRHRILFYYVSKMISKIVLFFLNS